MAGSNIGRLFELLRPYPWLLPLLAVLGIAASLAEAIGIGLLIPLLGSLLHPGSPATDSTFERMARELVLDEDGQLRFILVSSAVFLLILLKTLILAVYVYVASSMTGRIEKGLRIALWDRVIHAELAWFSRMDHGRLLNIIDKQTYRATTALTALNMLIVSACTVLVFGTFLFVLSLPMALIMIASGAPVFLFVRSLSARANRYGRSLSHAYASVASRIMELLTAMKTIRVFNQGEAETRRFAAAADDLRRTFVRTELLGRLIGPGLELLYLPVFLIVLGYALLADISMAVVLAFLLLLYRTQAPLKLVDSSRVNLATAAAALEDIEWLLKSTPDERARHGGRPFTGLRRRILIEEVRFGYHGADKPVLDGISVELKRGQVVALVGPSGAGKSTLVNLLFGLYVPDAGRILIDDAPLGELDMASWREHIAFAGQDSELFQGSTRFNIAYGRRDASFSQIEAAARSAHAHEFISALPQGYDTELGTRGTLISGGQRQRIALARALLSQPDLLVLDEATNAVDTATELAIQATIAELAGRTTILLIAHRTSTLGSADRVLVMEAGRIIEDVPPQKVSSKAALLAGLHSE